MRNWEQLHYTNTFGELVDKFNLNAYNSDFLDKMTGTILCNGVLFNGKETIDGQSILPLQNIVLPNIVNSDTILDNFILYFRDENKIIELDQFPIDLLSFNDNKIHFLYIKSDLTYRISDYMFGRADEILLGRFMITSNSTWNHFYLMAQRCGTPMYDAADEFYTVDGMYVKSPGGLELSQTSGSVKRSGIQFTDYNSPDIYEFYNLPSERVPIRYINELNEIDYRQEPIYNIITNRYMIYNMNTKLKIEAETYINDLRDMYYDIENYTSRYADELHTANLSNEDISIKRQIIDNYLISINNIYSVVDNLYSLLGNEVLSNIRRAGLLENKTIIMNFIHDNLINIDEINDNQVSYLNLIPNYIKDLNKSICDNPLSLILDTIEDDLKNITFGVGSIENVPEGKFTIQRILWDIYDRCLIIQYGDTIYDTYNEAVSASELLAYPAPWGKTIYIPLAVMLIKSGISSINEDEDTLIVPRRWIYVDQLQEGFIDYVARAKAQKALDLLNSLKDEVQNDLNNLKDEVQNDLDSLKNEVQNDLNNLKNEVQNDLDIKIGELKTALNGFIKYREYTVNFGSVQGYTDSVKQIGAFSSITGYKFLGFTVVQAGHNAVSNFSFKGRFYMYVNTTNNQITAIYDNANTDTLVVSCKFVAIFIKNSI